MMRSGRPFIWAIALSLLLHVILLLGIQIELPSWSAPPPLTVAIQTPPPPPASLPQPVRRPIKPAPKTSPIAQATPIVTADQSSIPTPVAPSEPTPLAQAPETPPPLAAPIDNRPAFPSQFELVYTVYRGEQGMSVGKTTHKWRVANNQYLLTSSTEATGLFSLFFSGRYILTSRGELSIHGLKPISFWIQRGQSGERTEFAEFDWEAKLLQYGKSDDRRNVALSEGTQDQLSVFYQLALTAPHSGRFKLALTTGRKFNQYDYQVIGEEMLETPLGPLKTQHVARVAQEAGSNADIWLAIDHHYLPVRFKLASQKGEILDHVIAELRVP